MQARLYILGSVLKTLQSITFTNFSSSLRPGSLAYTMVETYYGAATTPIRQLLFFLFSRLKMMFSRLTYMSQWLTNPRIKPVACYCSRGGGILVHRFVRPLLRPSFRSCSLAAAAAIFSGWSSVQQIAFSLLSPFFILFLHLSLTNALLSLSAYHPYSSCF